MSRPDNNTVDSIAFGTGLQRKPYPLWLFSTSRGGHVPRLCGLRSSENNTTWGSPMKKIALALALVVAGLSLGGCFVGKGKAPAPVVTKG